MLSELLHQFRSVYDLTHIHTCTWYVHTWYVHIYIYFWIYGRQWWFMETIHLGIYYMGVGWSVIVQACICAATYTQQVYITKTVNLHGTCTYHVYMLDSTYVCRFHHPHMIICLMLRYSAVHYLPLVVVVILRLYVHFSAHILFNFPVNILK